MLDEARERVANVAPSPPTHAALEHADRGGDGAVIERIGSVPLYAVDPLVRRARALQRTADGAFRGVHVNSRLARELSLVAGDDAAVQQNGTRKIFPVVVDDAIPDGCAGLATGVAETVELAPCFGPMNIEKA